MADETEQVTEQIDERVFKLSEPLKVDGKEISELSLDTKSLKAKDYIKLQAEFQRRYGRQGNLKLLADDQRYQLMVVARINGLVVEDLEENLNGDDFNAISLTVLGFLLSRLA